MKQIMLILSIMLLALCLFACRQNGEATSTLQSTTVTGTEAQTATEAKTEAVPEDAADWRDNYEVRDADAEVEKLLKHFSENRDLLESIALGMFKEQKESSLELHGKRGQLYVILDSNREGSFFDHAEPIESETGDLLAAYYAMGFSEAQDILMDNRHWYVDCDVCLFSYDAFLVEDGVLTTVDLIYCETENPNELLHYEYITIDDHWKICVVDYAF